MTGQEIARMRALPGLIRVERSASRKLRLAREMRALTERWNESVRVPQPTHCTTCGGPLAGGEVESQEFIAGEKPGSPYAHWICTKRTITCHLCAARRSLRYYEAEVRRLEGVRKASVGEQA